MENQVKTSTENKEQQLKKLSKMTMIRSLLPIAGLIIIFLMFNALTNFRMMNNLPLVLSQVYVTMISATGVFFIMTMGGLDFSQGSILGIASIVVCMVSKTSIPLAIVAGIAVGAAIGAINGYFYVYRKIKSFIVTICTMFLFRGFIKYLTTNAPVAGSAMLINFDSTELKLACTLVVLIIGFILFRFTKFGTYLKAIGAGEKAAMFSGIRTDRMKFLIYTNTSDDDVNVIEVESMIRALKAEGKKFEYKIFERAPGAHSFDRLDTYESSKIRLDIYKFMGRYLKPNKPFGSVKELRKAAYKF